MIDIQLSDSSHEQGSTAIFFACGEGNDYTCAGLSSDESLIVSKYGGDKKVINLLGASYHKIAVLSDIKSQRWQSLEAARRAGSGLCTELLNMGAHTVTITSAVGDDGLLLACVEGLALSAYYFDRHKKEKTAKKLQKIYISSTTIKQEQLDELRHIIKGTWLARNLVNEPASHQSAQLFSQEIVQVAEDAGFKAEVLNKKKIESLKMGGLLSVAAGSIDPPTFSILEWRPENARNTKPLILVGKGVVFDTGGLTLKPTPGSMDIMKSDMAGGAAVVGAMYAIASNKLPVHVVALIPATDNRPGERATAPGDVITMYDGTTVEVLNTDAEGRLILADALTYAKKYDPELVMDLATLTGSASRAVGHMGIVYMGTASKEVKEKLEESGLNTYERLVQFPFWDEYGEMLRSDVADLKNVSSGPSAGAITAGKFLEHFTAYPWLHLDIAGPAFLSSGDAYRTKNGSGVGVRLLYDFIKNNY